MPTKRKASSGSSSKAASSVANKSNRSKAAEITPLEELELADEAENGSWRRPSSKKLKSSEMPQNGPAEELDLTVKDRDDSPVSHKSRKLKRRDDEGEDESRFIGNPIPKNEARERWPYRYQGHTKKGKSTAWPETANLNNGSEEVIQARCHYTRAVVDGQMVCSIGDDAHVKGEEGQEDYICRIVEMFEAMDGLPYFTAQWYYRAKDTVIMGHSNFIHNKRVFFSEIKDDNPLDCLVKKIKIARLPLNMDMSADEATISNCDYYCNTMYFLPFSSFVKLLPDNLGAGSESDSTISSENDVAGVGDVKFDGEEVSQVEVNKKAEVALLDLFAGCGAMSTGLCLGANMCGVNLVTKWAVDLNKYACESLKYNHPETEVRNELAEDFLYLLKEWQKLCDSFSLTGRKGTEEQYEEPVTTGDDDQGTDDENNSNDDDDDDDSEVFEVEEILGICYGDPDENKKRGLYFKIRWKGYGADHDTWEPMEGLCDCPERIKKFVVNGFNSKILPLPGDVDVICGGPPCQGISGFNRFRNKESPLDDEKNKQLVVYMDIVEYLKPQFVLMENVVDILRFAGGFLGRYALGRLVGMNYQARMGMMAAGAYGLPQFRMRVFLWGARPTEKLPQYPLPTHDVIARGVIPNEFESSTVAYDEDHKVPLEKALFLGDAISDLPQVENDEQRDVMSYGDVPMTDFQRLIRQRRDEMLGCVMSELEVPEHALFDHRPLRLNDDDYQRVSQIPKRKGANFRDLKGVKVRDDKKVEWDPDIERVYLPSGKPLVPDYAMSFIGGTSSKPFGRLWWDETVPTVVTRAEPHNQTILHPSQDRVLTIRENARLQGFLDYYRLFGPIKERYIQVGNAVAVPVARALGYALASAIQGTCSDGPLCNLPNKFPNIIEHLSPAATEDVDH